MNGKKGENIMTLDELIEEIERSEEEAFKSSLSENVKNSYDLVYQQGKYRAFRICLDKLRKYRLSSGAE